MNRNLLLILVSGAVLAACGPVQGQTDPNDPASHYDNQPDRSQDLSPMSPLSSRLTQHLWQSRIAPPDPNEDIHTRQSIDELIRKIRAVKFEDTSPTQTFTPPPAEPVAKPKPNDRTESPVGTAVATPMMTMTAPETPLPAATLDKLDKMLEDPAQVRNPLEIAELLFLSGRSTEAGVFYERALALMPADDSGNSDDRAWALFQLGNCLRETDMSKAKDMYMKLVSDYPASPWTELAKAHGRLIAWYQSANPKQLIAQEESP